MKLLLEHKALVGLLVGLALALGLLAACSSPTPTPIVAPTTPPAPFAITATPAPSLPTQSVPPPAIFAGGTISTTTGAVQFMLVTGSTVVVAPTTALDLTQLPAPEAHSRHTLLTLLQGRLLVKAHLLPGDTFMIRTPGGGLAQAVGPAAGPAAGRQPGTITLVVFRPAAYRAQAPGTDTLMGVEYDPATSSTRVDCLEGHCSLGQTSDAGAGTPEATLPGSVDLTGGQSSMQSGDTPPNPPQDAQGQNWQDLNAILPTNTPVPTETPITPEIPAPAETVTPPTPLTPSPTVALGTTTPAPTATTVRGATATPNVAATRISFCATFQAQFPGTPCP